MKKDKEIGKLEDIILAKSGADFCVSRLTENGMGKGELSEQIGQCLLSYFYKIKNEQSKKNKHVDRAGTFYVVSADEICGVINKKFFANVLPTQLRFYGLEFFDSAVFCLMRQPGKAECIASLENPTRPFPQKENELINNENFMGC